MQIQIVWPERAGRVSLLSHHSQLQPLCFDVITGQFSAQRLTDVSQTLFWLRHQRLIVAAETRDYVCLVDGQPLEQGETQTLRNGSRIQAGPYLLQVFDDVSAARLTPLLPVEGDIPELTSLINHGGHYTPYRDAARYSSHSVNDNDPLKSLAQEYKHYLLWGEQQNISRGNEQQHNEPLRESFSDNMNIQDGIKNKTVTECVVENSVMMARIFKDLMIDAQDLPEDEEVSVELLRELAPEHLKPIEKRAVSELVYRELYKLGLDSHL